MKEANEDDYGERALLALGVDYLNLFFELSNTLLAYVKSGGAFLILFADETRLLAKTGLPGDFNRFAFFLIGEPFDLGDMTDFGEVTV